MKFFLTAEKYKYTFFALLLYILWVVCFTFYSFIEEKQKLYKVIDQNLVEAAQIPPLLLADNFHHKEMNKDSLTKDEGIKNTYKLSAFTDKNSIAYIYTLVLQNGKIFFTSSSATEEERSSEEGLTVFFDHYNDVDPRVFDVFNSKEKKFIEYSDQWGAFRSVFIPLQAEDGSYYLSAADIAIDDINVQLNQHLYRILTMALLFLVFAYPIYYTAIKQIKNLAAGLAQKVKQQKTELASNAERLRLAMVASKQGWFDLNLLTGEIEVNDEYPRLLGYPLGTSSSSLQEWLDNIHPDDKKAVLHIIEENLVGELPIEVEYRRRSKSGDWVWIHSIGQVIEWDENKKPCRMVGINTDITERKRSEQVLRTLAESGSVIDRDVVQHLVRELAISHNVQHVFIAYLDGHSEDSLTTLVVWAKDQFVDNFSYHMTDTPCELIKQQDVVFYPNNLQQLFPKDLMLAEMGAVSYLGVPLKNSKNKVLGLLGMIDDKPMKEDLYRLGLLGSLAVRLSIELERREAEKQLKLSSQVFKAAHEGIVITDVAGVIVDVNPAFFDITGYSREESIGQNPRILRSGKHSTDFFTEMWSTLVDQGFWKGELWNRKKGGELYAELLTISAIVNDDGKTQNYIGLFSDITKSKEQQKSLELMAHYDELTGLPNRSLFADRFKQAIAHSKRTETLLAVCFLDLDEFKPVNDNYGHLVGDQLLIEVADRIKSQLRAEDTVSRMGGDEFALLLGDLSSQAQCENMLERLHHSLAHAFSVDGYEISLSASSGITLYPWDNADLDTLLRHADQAMYKAKLAGRNQYQLFDFEEDQQRVSKQLRIQAIKEALLHGEMQLYYQPKVNMKTGEVIGAEALLRWMHPEDGLILPLDFLPIIDGTEVEIQLGEWVIEAALQQLDYWQSVGLIIEVSINISSYHIQSPYFIDVLSALLEQYPEVNSNYLQLEILESSVLGDIGTIKNIISACQNELGLHIALDDFGTGYSSLAHLRNLPANTLKIDRSFVKDVLDDVNDCAIVDGIIGLADAFNREVIAEGVETQANGTMMLLMGCEQAQGFFIAQPMPTDEIAGWVKNYRPNSEWIHFGTLEYSPAQNKIKLFQLCFEQWYQVFSQNIKSAPNQKKNWPILNQQKCHHAIRLKQIKLEHLFSLATQQKIEQNYASFQLVTDGLFNKYTHDDVAGAMAGLDELDEIYQLINGQLEHEL